MKLKHFFGDILYSYPSRVSSGLWFVNEAITKSLRTQMFTKNSGTKPTSCTKYKRIRFATEKFPVIVNKVILHFAMYVVATQRKLY